jgi:sodium/proline symporter
MSTADGLVVSSSQIIANDLYRRTIAPRLKTVPTEEVLDKQVLTISRVSTVVVLLICMFMAWRLIQTNIALIVWIGVGGMMAAFAGPLVVGAIWRGVTKAGAYSGLVTGLATFALLHTQAIDPNWLEPGTLRNILAWLHAEGPNPFSCAAIGEFVSITATFFVSKATRPLDANHVREIFEGT